MAEATRGRGETRHVLLHEWSLELWGPADLDDESVGVLVGGISGRLGRIVAEGLGTGLDGVAGELRLVR